MSRYLSTALWAASVLHASPAFAQQGAPVSNYSPTTDFAELYPASPAWFAPVESATHMRLVFDNYLGNGACESDDFIRMEIYGIDGSGGFVDLGGHEGVFSGGVWQWYHNEFFAPGASFIGGDTWCTAGRFIYEVPKNPGVTTDFRFCSVDPAADLRYCLQYEIATGITTVIDGASPPPPPPPPPPVDAGVAPDLGPPDLGPPDFGPPDLGPPDLGPPDLGPPDLGPPDLGPPDLGPPDLGPPDLGPPDLGPPDLGLPDLGPPDLGPPDLGPSDLGTSDLGAPDLGAPDAGSGAPVSNYSPTTDFAELYPASSAWFAPVESATHMRLVFDNYLGNGACESDDFIRMEIYGIDGSGGFVDLGGHEGVFSGGVWQWYHNEFFAPGASFIGGDTWCTAGRFIYEVPKNPGVTTDFRFCSVDPAADLRYCLQYEIATGITTVIDGASPPPPPPPPVDAGVGQDAGTPDQGPAPDAGVVTGPNLVEETGHGIAGFYYGSLDTADFDGDGLVDVVIAGAIDSAFTEPFMSSFTFDNRVRVYRNISTPGNVQFELWLEPSQARGGGGAIAKAGDFNGDGLADFAVQFREGGSPLSDSAVYLNGGNGAFTRTVLGGGFDTNNNSLGMEVTDIDQNGNDDVVFISDGYGAAPGLWYSLDTATNTWIAQQTSFTHNITYGGAIAAGDLTGDGYPEIAVGGNASLPFGTYDCSSTLLYGQVHRNNGGLIEGGAWAVLGDYAMQADPVNPSSCSGQDNAQLLIRDLNNDGNNDIILVGSHSDFIGPPGSYWSHYDFAVLYNNDGSGQGYITWENAGPPFPAEGATNGGAGNVDFPGVAAGDLTGDGYPEIFFIGHHRDYANNPGGYVFTSKLFLNEQTQFSEVQLNIPQLAQCGAAIADFDGDGNNDIIYCGASLPFHTNGNNAGDYNDSTTISTVVLRNVP